MNNVKHYRYPSSELLRVFSTRIAGILGVFAFGGLALTLIAVQLGNQQFYFVPTCSALGLLIGAIGSLTVLNLYPDVRVSDDAVSISFMFGRVKIPSHALLGVHETMSLPRQTIVVARTITPLHYLYGVIYGGTFHPGFIVSPTLEGYHELISEINKRVRANLRQISR